MLALRVTYRREQSCFDGVDSTKQQPIVATCLVATIAGNESRTGTPANIDIPVVRQPADHAVRWCPATTSATSDSVGYGAAVAAAVAVPGKRTIVDAAVVTGVTAAATVAAAAAAAVVVDSTAVDAVPSNAVTTTITTTTNVAVTSTTSNTGKKHTSTATASVFGDVDNLVSMVPRLAASCTGGSIATTNCTLVPSSTVDDATPQTRTNRGDVGGSRRRRRRGVWLSAESLSKELTRVFQVPTRALFRDHLLIRYYENAADCVLDLREDFLLGVRDTLVLMRRYQRVCVHVTPALPAMRTHAYLDLTWNNRQLCHVILREMFALPVDYLADDYAICMTSDPDAGRHGNSAIDWVAFGRDSPADYPTGRRCDRVEPDLRDIAWCWLDETHEQLCLVDPTVWPTLWLRKRGYCGPLNQLYFQRPCYDEQLDPATLSLLLFDLYADVAEARQLLLRLVHRSETTTEAARHVERLSSLVATVLPTLRPNLVARPLVVGQQRGRSRVREGKGLDDDARDSSNIRQSFSVERLLDETLNRLNSVVFLQHSGAKTSNSNLSTMVIRPRICVRAPVRFRLFARHLLDLRLIRMRCLPKIRVAADDAVPFVLADQRILLYILDSTNGRRLRCGRRRRRHSGQTPPTDQLDHGLGGWLTRRFRSCSREPSTLKKSAAFTTTIAPVALNTNLYLYEPVQRLDQRQPHLLFDPHVVVTTAGILRLPSNTVKLLPCVCLVAPSTLQSPPLPPPPPPAPLFQPTTSTPVATGLPNNNIENIVHDRPISLNGTGLRALLCQLLRSICIGGATAPARIKH